MFAATITVSLGAGAVFAGPDDRPDLKVAMPSTWASHGPTVNSNFGARVAYSIYDTLVWRNYLSGPGGSGSELVPGFSEPSGSQIREPLDIHNVGDPDSRHEKVLGMIEAVSLPEHLLERYPHQLSGGQQQRVGIARALINSPKLVVCDESVSALDVPVQAQVVNLLADLQKKLGLTYLFITHDLSVVRHISSRIAVMYLGRIVELASSDELMENPMHPYTRALISAVPVPDPRARKSRATISGEPPSPFELPPGCAFHARCPHADAKCRSQLPDFREISGDHMIACHHAENLL